MAGGFRGVPKPDINCGPTTLTTSALIRRSGVSQLREYRRPNGSWVPALWHWILPGRQGAAYPSEGANAKPVNCPVHSVVDSKAQVLFAPEVPFRRLDRDVSKQKLDLVQLTTGQMAEPRAAAPKIMRREFLNSGTRRGDSDDLPQDLGRHARSPDRTRFADRSRERAFDDAGGFLPFIDR